MTEQTTAYFRKMYEESERYHQEKHLREDESKALIAADDWDAVGVWIEREKQFKDPFTAGQYKAYWAFNRSFEIEADEMEMEDFLWKNEVKDFSDTLRAAGVTAFILTNQSTALMENIHSLEAQGWRMVGTCTLPKKEILYGNEYVFECLGLRFEIEKEG